MRYLPLDAVDRAQMLTRVGAPDIDALFADIPAAKRLAAPLDLPNGLGEIEVERRLARMAGRNVAAGSVPFFLGAGAYRHHVPATVDHLIQRSEFLTSYTPYQPEIAQGTLQVLFEFQTPGRGADRHGGRQRVDVRRLDRLRRGDPDGASRHAPAQGGAVGRPASAIFRRRRHARRDGERRDRPPAARSARRARTSRPRSTTRRAASSSSRPTSSATCATSSRSPPPPTPRARCWSPSSPRRFRSARCDRPARWTPTSSSAKASRSATRSISAAPMSACSRPG